MPRTSHTIGTNARASTPVQQTSVDVTAPAAVNPGEPTNFTYQFTDLETLSPVTDIVDSHERPMHLIAVSGDLGQFQHIHPAPTGAPGRFEITATFPSAGNYILFGEAQRANGENVVKRHDLTVGPSSGSTGSAPAAARLADDSSPKTVGNVRVSVSGAEGVRARREATLTFRLENAQTGQPLTDLQPYLGAPAHAVILSEDTTWFAHTHGEGVGTAPADGHASGGHGAADHADAPAAFGPEIAVRYTFRVPGLYKVWAQFQSASGEVIAADYVVRVAQ